MASQLPDFVDEDRAQAEPMSAAAPATTWRRWLTVVTHLHRWALGVVGLTLLAGFGLAVVAMIAFAILARVVMDQGLLAFDVAALAWVQGFASPTMDTVMVAISALGAEALNVLMAVLAVLFVARRRHGAAVTLLVVGLGANLLNSALKAIFMRPRPTPLDSLIPAQAYSFPSGHAMVSAAFYFFLAYLGWHLFRGWLRGVWAGGFVLLILAIGVSRMYLNVHYLTDVVAGFIAGFVWTQAVIIGGHVLDRTWRSRTVNPSLAARHQRQGEDDSQPDAAD